MSVAIIPGTPYHAASSIPERDINNDDKIRGVYATFVFKNLLEKYEPNPIMISHSSSSVNRYFQSIIYQAIVEKICVLTKTNGVIHYGL